MALRDLQPGCRTLYAGNPADLEDPFHRIAFDSGRTFLGDDGGSILSKGRGGPVTIVRRYREQRFEMNPRISMITLGVRDLAASVQFYEEGLGFPRMKSPPEVAFFTLNGTWLGLFGRDELAADASMSSEGSGFESFALAHNVRTEGEVDDVMTQALNAGATLAKQPARTDWGGYSGYFKDPDGHLWEIAHNPHFWVGPSDSTD